MSAGVSDASGTLWWINPRSNTAAVLMTQRYFGSGDPSPVEFKRLAYRALDSVHGAA